jgi:transcriptional regulator with XRE-family HTH domain
MTTVASTLSMKNLELKIKSRLAEKGMTIQRLASESGISEPTIHAIFNRGDAKLSQLEKIAEALNISLNFLLSEESQATITQAGDFNQAGHSNTQKVKISKAQDLVAELDQCHRDNESLKRELALANALVASKDETITLLRATYSRPN